MPEDRETRNVDEIVMPDLADNTWPTPRGFPVQFEDGRAYFIAAAAKSGRASALIDSENGSKSPLDAAQDVQARWEGNDATPSEYIACMERLALVALSLQYAESTINRLIDDGGLTAKVYSDVVLSTMGAGPSYKVVAKKK